jgi:hypothetical protein
MEYSQQTVRKNAYNKTLANKGFVKSNKGLSKVWLRVPSSLVLCTALHYTALHCTVLSTVVLYTVL